MPGFFSKLKNGISRVLTLIFFPGNATQLERFIRYLRNFVLLCIISFLLWYVCKITKLEANIKAPFFWLRQYWLVLIFWISLLGSLATRRLIWTLNMDPADSMFPEIQRAWKNTCNAMAELGLDPSQLPIFLVLGHRESEGSYLFDSQQLRLRDIRLRDEFSQPFHVDVSDSAIFIICNQTSLTGVLSNWLSQNQKKSGLAIKNSGASQSSVIPASLLGINHHLDEKSPEMLDRSKSKPDQEFTLSNSNHFEEVYPSSHDDIMEVSEKLRYLCGLVAESRKPYCSLNGILVVLPLSIGDSVKLTSHTLEMVQSDIQIIKEETGLDLPYAVLCTELNAYEGFDELVPRLKEASKLRYLGLALPTRLDLKTQDWARQIRKGLRWYHRSIMTSLIYKNILSLDPEKPNPSETGRQCMIRENHMAFTFLQKTRKSWDRITELCVRLGENHISRYHANPRFSGLFLTGLDNQGTGPWIFMHDMARHLINQQNSVAWTINALKKNRLYKRLSYFIFFAVFLILIVVLFILFGS